MKRFAIRLINMIIGLFLYALGIIVTIRANVGFAPWDVFHVGIANTIGLSLGTVSILVGIIIVVVIMISGEKLGLGTISNMLLIGIFLDIILKINVIPKMDNTIFGILMLIFGLFIISIGSYFYIGSAFGAGPRDSLMVVLAKKTKIPVGISRSIIEILVTIGGYFLGGMVGLGTLISAIGIGFCVQITFRILKFNVTAIKHESIRDTFTELISNMKSRK